MREFVSKRERVCVCVNERDIERGGRRENVCERDRDRQRDIERESLYHHHIFVMSLCSHVR